jgi:hypothetical protein
MKPLKKNIAAAKALIEKYNTISLKEIRELWQSRPSRLARNVARDLTGFGSTTSCTLCITTRTPKENTRCRCCIYKKERGCTAASPRIEITYNHIEDVENPTALLKAFRERAKLIQRIVQRIERGAKK